MRTKLLSAILLASTALAGVASADPIVRDHRDYREQPTMNYYQSRARFIRKQPSWMQYSQPAVYGSYGYQVDADGDEVVPYNQGQDPYVEGIARNDWMTLASNVRFAHGQDTEISLNLGGERLQSLELQQVSGRTFVREVHVVLNDGREIKLQPTRMLDAQSAPNLRLDLGAQASCGIRKVELFGHTSVVGGFDVIAA